MYQHKAHEYQYHLYIDLSVVLLPRVLCALCTVDLAFFMFHVIFCMYICMCNLTYVYIDMCEYMWMCIDIYTGCH